MIRFFNTLTRRVDNFTPLNSTKVCVYSCGPTVYDHVHIGNLSSFIYADTLNRVLEVEGYEVKHVMNITDVDDKTIKRSKIDFPDVSPEAALIKLTSLYTEIFKSDMEKVGNRLSEITFIKATDSIHLMQKLILELLDRGFAYIAEDGIYFSIEAYIKSGKTYGQLTDIKLSNTSKSRINNDEYDKRSIHDFALWKFQQENEPEWPFRIGKLDYPGRPGWHIECSAMSTHLLDQPFDVHTGGVDLIFPHHENEIAQSTAITKTKYLASLFFHNEHMLVNNQKMSKSLGNVYSLSDVLLHDVDPLAFRLLVLQSHYRSHSEFSWDLLVSAQNRLRNLQNLSSLRFQTIKSNNDIDDKYLTKLKNDIKTALEDDMNTPKALAIISEWANVIEEKLISDDQLHDFLAVIQYIDSCFGLDLASVKDISDDQKHKIALREQARANSDWVTSDQIRDGLAKEGLGLRDGQNKAIWFRQ